ncbi:MAG: sigma 54-interacting transcriptional regulator [Blastocatellia bacterium]
MTFRVLIVEDSQIHLESKELWVRNLDPQQKELVGIDQIKIDTAVCASEARAFLEQAAQSNTPYGLLLLDLSLPEQRGEDDKPEHGLNLLELARTTDAAKLIIISSAFANFQQYTALAFGFGADDLLSKPYSKDKLHKSILAGLQKHRALQDSQTGMVKRLQENIRGQSRLHLKALEQLAQVIPNANVNILLLGESGTGKELFARAIHDHGARAGNAFKGVNVAAIPSNLIESELFGHERGAFTDAKERRTGFFEEAGDGTLFLDEIGNLDPPLQVKLLRAIDGRRFYAVGGRVELPFRARLICATHPRLRDAVNQRVFREDLFYRISTVTIDLPPLRERRGDVELLLQYYLDRLCGDRQVRFADDVLKFLCDYGFPGNVRELKNLVESALTHCEGDKILLRHLPWPNMNKNAPIAAEPDELEDRAIRGLFQRMAAMMQDGWQHLPYEKKRNHCLDVLKRAFDQIHLEPELARHQYKVSRLAQALGIDEKTFHTRWKNADLPPLKPAK